MPRELSQCRKWEQQRRCRLAESFNKLRKVLPSYDPAVTISKIDILSKATIYIEELEVKVKNFLTSNSENKPAETEIKQLYERIKQLLLRNEQLQNLLKDAGISIPSECGSTIIWSPKVWADKVTPDKAEKLAKLEAQKENEPKKVIVKTSPKKKIIPKAKPIKVKFNKKLQNKPNKVKNGNVIINTGTLNPIPNIMTVPTVQPCYFITNNTNRTLTTIQPNTTVATNSNIINSMPITSNTSIITKPNTFPTGTIILPVVQQPTLLNSPIILNTPPTNTLILLNNKKIEAPKLQTTSNTTKTQNVITKTYSAIQPKRRSITKTTHINKVPIPASRYASNYILVSKVPIHTPHPIIKRIVKKPKVKQKIKRKPIEKIDEVVVKKKKLDETNPEKVVVEDESKKVPSSNYSIDSICKDKPKDVPQEKVVQKENSKEKEPETPVVTEAVIISERKKIPPEIVETKSNEQKEKPPSEETKPAEIPDALGHSELSNDIFASLHVPSGSQNPESTSPTAAFLNAFPLVSSFTGVKVAEVMEEETSDSRHDTPTILQIGTMDNTKPTQTLTDSLTPSLLNLDNFSFFSTKEICSNLYTNFEAVVTSSVTPVPTVTTAIVSSVKTMKDVNVITKTAKILYDNAISDTATTQAQAKLANYQNQVKIPTTYRDNLKVTVTASVANISSLKTKIDKSIVTTQSYAVTSSLNYSVSNTQTYSVSNSYSQSFYSNTQVVNSTMPQVTASVNNYSNQIENKVKPNEKPSCSRYSYNISEYNTFNPFTDIPKSNPCTYVTTKSYNQPMYTNNTNCNYNYQADFNTNYAKKGEKDKYYGMNYENYDNTNQYNYYNPPQLKANKAKTENVPRPPVNWMTTPDLKQQSDFVMPPFPKEAEFVPNIYTQNTFVSNSQTTYFNTTAPIYPTSDFHNTFTEGKKLDTQYNNTFQRNDIEEHQFSWSPTKLPQLLDPPHSFVSTTLPTLVGDLALGTTQYSEKTKLKAKERRNPQNYDATTNFLSVSQLVDHTKPEVPARISTRRNSGGRSKTASKSNKRSSKPENKETILSTNYKTNEKNQMKMQNVFPEPPMDWMADTKRNKNPPSSYSAEALIGHGQTGNLTNKQRPQQQNYSKTLPVPSFLPDNLITYFPTVDIQQDNTFSQQNQNYQNNTFTHSFPSSMQNNTYSGTFIPNSTTTYLPSSNFIAEIADYNPMIPDNIFSHSNPKPPDNKQFKNHQTKTSNKQIFNNTTPKKSKKKQSADNTPGFVDFSFLSMPAAINSPILPDDFHAHSNFLPPPPNPNQLYSCKNPLYPKQSSDLGGSLLPLPPVTRTNIQHPEISPSLNTVGTSLTNFNLSTIFPEINKSTVPDMYLDPTKNKDYGIQRSYLPSTSQIPSFSKAPVYSSITSQPFTNS